MHDDGLLEQKAWAAGIASGYHDVDGRYYPAKPGVLAAVLALVLVFCLMAACIPKQTG